MYQRMPLLVGHQPTAERLTGCQPHLLLSIFDSVVLLIMLMYSEAILISGGTTATTGLGFTYRESNLNFYTKIYSAMNNICHLAKSDETCIEDQ